MRWNFSVWSFWLLRLFFLFSHLDLVVILRLILPDVFSLVLETSSSLLLPVELFLVAFLTTLLPMTVVLESILVPALPSLVVGARFLLSSRSLVPQFSTALVLRFSSLVLASLVLLFSTVVV